MRQNTSESFAKASGTFKPRRNYQRARFVNEAPAFMRNLDRGQAVGETGGTFIFGSVYYSFSILVDVLAGANHRVSQRFKYLSYRE